MTGNSTAQSHSLTDSINIELDGKAYALVKETLGDDYIYVKQKSIVARDKTTEHSDGTKVTIKELVLDSDLYEHYNLVTRLRIDGERVPDETVRALPRSIYSTLNTVALKLDNEEAGKTTDFLSIAFSAFPDYKSRLETLLASQADSSEDTSEEQPA